MSTLSNMQSIPIVSDILQQLAHSLPMELYYHSVDHTRMVLNNVIDFASYEKTNEKDIELLAIAAAYHDAGYMERYNSNEEIGANMAKAAMEKQGGYSSEEAQQVVDMILSTQVVSTPEAYARIVKTELAHYLLDADLSVIDKKTVYP